MQILLIKSFHIIAMVAWFAGIFYLPRLFVYHAMTEDQPGLERFKVMERKLYRGIMTPSMIVTIALGLWLFHFGQSYYLQAGWFHAKMTLVLLLVIYHFYCGHLIKRFRENQNSHSHVFYRWFNEVPVLLLIGIVVLVVLKPF